MELSSISDRIIVSVGDDLMPHCRLKNDKVKVVEVDMPLVVEMTEEKREIINKAFAETEKLRFDNFTNGVDLFKNFRYIEIDKISKNLSGWAYFDKPKKIHLLNLISSIESMGVLSPLFVKPTNDSNYVVICGQSRLSAMRNIYHFKKDDRYKYIPCFVIEENLDEYFERSMIIDSNLNYRSTSHEIFIKAILEKYEILKRTKSYRNEINIAKKIADEFSISEATFFNYLTLNRLCNEAMTLVYERRLKLNSARMLSKLSHENQLYILENVDLSDVNAKHKIKALTSNKNAKLKEIQIKSKFIKEFIPQETNVTITLNKDVLHKFFDVIIDFKKYVYTEFSKDHNIKQLKKLVKIKLDDEDMKFYVKHSFLSEKIIENVYAKELNEVLLN